MSFRLLILNSLYSPYLEHLYAHNSDLAQQSYDYQYNYILNDTSEPIGPYTIEYCKQGVETKAVIENAAPLQQKWALENGVPQLKGKSLVLEQIARFNPDVVLIENVAYVDAAWINQLRTCTKGLKLIAISHCAPYNTNIVEKFKSADLLVTCTPGLQIQFTDLGLKTHLVYHAFNSSLVNRIDSVDDTKKHDFVFSGSLLQGGGFHNDRINLIENLLSKNIDLKIYGNIEKSSKIRAKQSVYYAVRLLNACGLDSWIKSIPVIRSHNEYGDTPIKKYSQRLREACNPPIFGVDMFKLLQSSKIVLNNHGAVAGNYAGNVRLFEATGVGACLLTDNKQNLPDLFDVSSEIVVYDSFDDCAEKVKWLLNNDNEREKIAQNGQKRTLRDHNVANRCSQLIDIFSKELSK